MAENFPRNGGESSPEPVIGPPTMSPSFLKWAAVIIGLIVLFGVLSFGRGVYTDLLWFDNLGFRSIFVKVTVTRITLVRHRCSCYGCDSQPEPANSSCALFG